jgi:hypothetical protein
MLTPDANNFAVVAIGQVSLGVVEKECGWWKL